MSKVSSKVRKPFTGWHMAAILVAGFGVVVAVNVLMATLASTTFGGIVVENSYVASQKFNTWLDEAETERALGWDVALARREDGHLVATLAGAPAYAAVTAVARHPLGHQPDTTLHFAADGAGGHISDAVLPDGRWTVRLMVEAGGKTWRGERDVS